MALTQPGAGYERRSHFSKQEHLQAALDSLASQNAAIRNQLNVGEDGVTQPPSAPTTLLVTNSSGLYTVSIAHNAPTGTRWWLEYSPSQNFVAPIQVDLGEAKSWQNYLPNQKLYFRVFSKFLASGFSQAVYFGNSANPTAV